jgi:hypothetical protein
MPQGRSLPSQLAFVHGGLHVAYRASAEPQLVDLYVELTAPDRMGRVPILVRRLVDEINGGAAGGAQFPPAQGRARCLSGPLSAREPGPVYRYVLDVAGVSPQFLRHLVETASAGGDVRTLAVRGALPLDDGPLSVREAQVSAWLHQPRTHMEAYAPHFPVRDLGRQGRSGFVRAALVDGTSDDLLRAFDEVLLVFSGLLLSYGPPGGIGRSRVVLPPSAGRGGRVLAARWSDFSCERGPARDALVNVMSAFHARTAQIERLDVGLPG